jgi:alpha-ribazole phosphatase
MSANLDIFLIRHSKPLIEAGTCYGQLDCPVCDDYPLQLAKVSDYFSDKKINAIYSSPLIRCRKLAEDLAKSLINKPIIYMDGFKEIHFGEWEGKRWDDIPRDKIDEWNEDRLHFQFPEGETPHQFHLRVYQAWSELITSASNIASPQKIVLVTHSGVIGSLLCRHFNIALENVTELKVHYASITHLRL